MIDEKSFKKLIEKLEFLPTMTGSTTQFEKTYVEFDYTIKVNFDKKKIFYPEEKGIIVNNHNTCNFSDNENFVVLECVNRLLCKGYRPEHIELEKEWPMGHTSKGGRADICVYDKNGTDMLCIIECKTAGSLSETLL